MTLLPRATKPMRDVPLNDEAEAVMEEADNFARRFSLVETDAVCVLAALVTPGVGFTFDQLKTLPLTTAEICARMDTDKGTGTQETAPAAVAILISRQPGREHPICPSTV